ncbi:hypothetical protein LIER_29574 [Lithospermum erythrorhizon]|uniref:Uncharacterized protein n=1 Tax=Lithospermum erythrorhizon TaxID=34254 RepID=A0AAV3RJN7_LITER
MERAVETLNKLANNTTFLNVFLMGIFGTLSFRSMQQQNQIFALEAEKDSILKTNKTIKKTIWDWKHQLFTEAESNPQNALVPLSTLRAIYGEATPVGSDAGNKTQKGDGKSPPPKWII